MSLPGLMAGARAQSCRCHRRAGRPIWRRCGSERGAGPPGPARSGDAPDRRAGAALAVGAARGRRWLQRNAHRGRCAGARAGGAGGSAWLFSRDAATPDGGSTASCRSGGAREADGRRATRRYGRRTGFVRCPAWPRTRSATTAHIHLHCRGITGRSKSGSAISTCRAGAGIGATCYGGPADPPRRVAGCSFAAASDRWRSRGARRSTAAIPER